MPPFVSWMPFAEFYSISRSSSAAMSWIPTEPWPNCNRNSDCDVSLLPRTAVTKHFLIGLRNTHNPVFTYPNWGRIRPRHIISFGSMAFCSTTSILNLTWMFISIHNAIRTKHQRVGPGSLIWNLFKVMGWRLWWRHEPDGKLRVNPSKLCNRKLVDTDKYTISGMIITIARMFLLI